MHWAWKMILKNRTAANKYFFTTIRFVDKEGFELDETYRNVEVGGGETKTFTGTIVVKSGVFSRIDKIDVSLE
jgi:hypothetical protein